MNKIVVAAITLSIAVWADFSRSSVGIVTDSTTGLQWQDAYEDNEGNVKVTSWRGAINYCEALTLGGKYDWRLPNQKELLTLVDYGEFDPSINDVFQNTMSYNYWSSTTRVNATGQVWLVYFKSGSIDSPIKSASSYVRCVRGGQ